MTKRLVILFTTMAVLPTLISCQGAPVEIKDQLWYHDKGPLGAVRFHSMNNLSLKIPKNVWDSLDTKANPDARYGMYCTSAATVGEIKKELELLCSYYGYCEYPDFVQAKAFLDRMEKVKKMDMTSVKSLSEEVEVPINDLPLP